MSIRAYRVVEIMHAKPESFNLWHDTVLMEFLEDNSFYANLNDDACGLSAIPVHVMQEALDTLVLQDEIKKSIQKDISFATILKQDYITYYCY